MASLTRTRPTSRVSCSLQYLHKTQSRSLSASPYHQASVAAAAGSMMRQMPKQQAINTRIKKLKRSEIPSDVGVIPNTFIRPCGNMASWFSHPVTRFRTEWLYFKQWSVDAMQQIFLLRWRQPKDPLTGRRKKIPLQWRDRYVNARNLHSQLYKALASRDKNTISEIACAGLANEQLGRLERARILGSPSETWSVKYRGLVLPSRLPASIQFIIPSYFKAIHVVADRQVTMPVGQGFTLRQAIFRVDSTQTLQRNDGSDPVSRNLREYIVLQKMIFPDESEEWKIWGTVKPSDTEDAMEILKASKAEGGSMFERMRTMLPGLS